MTKAPWLKQYPCSIPHTIDYTQYTSLIHFMEEAFNKYQEFAMCENMGKVLTYQQVNQLSQAFCAYLQHSTTLQVGDRVAIQLPNLLQYPIAMLGILRAGLIGVNINPQYTPYEMIAHLNDSKAQAIIILENFAYKLEEILPNTSIKTVIIARVSDLFNPIKRGIVNFTIKYIKKLIKPYHLPNTILFKDILVKGSKMPCNPIPLKPTDTAFLQYTGGTTGLLKAAMLSHENIIANIQQLNPIMRLALHEGKECMMIPLPLYHIFGLSCLFATAKIGGKMVFITNPRDMERFVKLFRKYQPTCLIGIHTLFEKLLNNPQFKKVNFSSLKLTVAGGMKTQQEVKTAWINLTGSQFFEGYGLTECAPVITTDMINGKNHIPIPNTFVMIADDQGKQVPYGTAGELLVKGPQVTKAYWGNHTETQHAFINGWLKTGDIAVMDQDGGITIIDRKKDMINISGFNVYPHEIEQVLIGHPKVLEVGAVGILDISLKEAIKVFIVKKDATLTAEEIINFCKEKLTRYKVPKYVEFRKSLPKSSIGKILRRLLKDPN